MTKILISPNLSLQPIVTKFNLKRLVKKSKIEALVMASEATHALMAEVSERYTMVNRELVGNEDDQRKFNVELASTSKALENIVYNLVNRQFQGDDISWDVFEQSFALRLQARLVEVGLLESEQDTLTHESRLEKSEQVT